MEQTDVTRGCARQRSGGYRATRFTLNLESCRNETCRDGMDQGQGEERKKQGDRSRLWKPKRRLEPWRDPEWGVGKLHRDTRFLNMDPVVNFLSVIMMLWFWRRTSLFSGDSCRKYSGMKCRDAWKWGEMLKFISIPPVNLFLLFLRSWARESLNTTRASLSHLQRSCESPCQNFRGALQKHSFLTVTGWIVSPQNSYVEVLTPSTS